MESYTVIACENLKNEIEYVIKDLKINPKIIWIESQLHNVPSELNKKLQSNIDKCNDEYILLFFGCCGNSTISLSSEKSRIICPKVDDCISCFLGGNENRKLLKDSERTYFFTKGYIENKLSIYNEIEMMKEKYGDKKTKMIYGMMLKNYMYIRIIDTGCYNVEDILDKSTSMAKEWNLKHEIVKGDLSIFYQGFKGKWDENFIILEKGEKNKLDNYTNA